MVFNIKKTTNFTNDIGQICKTMINIEQNKNIYNLQGGENPAKLANKPFNTYTYKQVDYNISASMGVLIIYEPDPITFVNLYNLMVCKFAELNKDTSDSIPYIDGDYKSTQHTLVTLKNVTFDTSVSLDTFSKSYRKIIASEPDIKKCCESGSKFVWYIHISNNPYLYISELSNHIPSNYYLMRSVSTIIYDGCDLFNINTGSKQINYPALSQYNLFNSNKILESTILISDTYGLDCDIISYYTGDYNNTKINITFSKNYNIEQTFNLVDYKTLEICRVNKGKSWNSQLNDIFDYKLQEELELNIKENGKPSFPNNICFITHMPLYQNVYVLKIALREATVNPVNYTDIKYIMIAPILYHSIINGKGFRYYFTDMCEYDIMEVFISDYPTTELDAIALIHSNKIDPVKRDILKCISKNGYYNSTGNIYTLNLKKKVIYVGLDNFRDTDIIKYKSTSTILFNYKKY